MEWISVKDRLPTDKPFNSVVIVTMYSHNKARKFVTPLHCIGGEWFTMFDEDVLDVEYEVTHWMPLPEAASLNIEQNNLLHKVIDVGRSLREIGILMPETPETLGALAEVSMALGNFCLVMGKIALEATDCMPEPPND